MKILLLAQPAQTLRQIPWDLRGLRERLGKYLETCATCANPSEKPNEHAPLDVPLIGPLVLFMRGRQLSMAVGSFYMPTLSNQRSSSRHGTASQWSFWPRPATGRRLNGHFGLVPPREGVSTVILASSRHRTASQPSFWPRPATGRRLNGYFGLVPPRDGVSTVILASFRHGTASSRSSAPSSSDSASCSSRRSS